MALNAATLCVILLLGLVYNASTQNTDGKHGYPGYPGFTRFPPQFPTQPTCRLTRTFSTVTRTFLRTDNIQETCTGQVPVNSCSGTCPSSYMIDPTTGFVRRVCQACQANFITTTTVSVAFTCPSFTRRTISISVTGISGCQCLSC